MNDVLPYQNLTVLAPSSADSMLPTEIIDDSSPIRAGFVERKGIENLPRAWKEACGFYLLFSHMDAHGGFQVYVGKASNGFYGRLRSHDKDKPWWSVALMVFKDREPGFSSTQSAFMEGKMREILDRSSNATVENIAPTGDRTLPRWEESAMEAIAVSTLRIMGLRGYRAVPRVEAAPDAADRPLGRHRAEPAPELPPAPEEFSEASNERFEKLRAWRLEVARGAGWPAYAVFYDTTLRAIANANPKSPEDLHEVPGVSPGRATKYGDDIVRVLAAAG